MGGEGGVPLPSSKAPPPPSQAPARSPKKRSLDTPRRPHRQKVVPAHAHHSTPPHPSEGGMRTQKAGARRHGGAWEDTLPHSGGGGGLRGVEYEIECPRAESTDLAS